MIIQKSDLTQYAIELGIWDELCEMTGVDPKEADQIRVDMATAVG